MSVFRVLVRYELWVNVPVAIFFGTVDWEPMTLLGGNPAMVKHPIQWE